MILIRKALLLRVWVFSSWSLPNICRLKIVVLIVFISSTTVAFGQEADTIQSKELEPLVVTATRTERTVGALPMPVVLVSKAEVRTMGSLRLTEVLAEQTGLAVVPQVNGQGSGIQVQGLSPDYTLILLNGEPLIGRYTG